MDLLASLIFPLPLEKPAPSMDPIQKLAHQKIYKSESTDNAAIRPTFCLFPLEYPLAFFWGLIQNVQLNNPFFPYLQNRVVS